MKPILTILSIAIIAAILLAQCQLRNTGDIAHNPGKRLYDKYCVDCHLITGQGGPAPGNGLNAPDIRKFKKSPEELIPIITHGYGEMPAFGDSMTTEEIEMVADYVASDIEQ